MEPWEMDWGTGAPKAQPDPWEMDWGGKAKPEASGFTALQPGLAKGIMANLPGAPMDTVLNMVDLSRAAYGFLGNKAGLLSPSQMPELINRENVPFSAAANAKRIRESGRAELIDNPLPDNPLARVLYAGAETAPMAAVSPGGGAAKLVRNMVGAGVAGAAGQTAAEAGGGPEEQVLASWAAPVAATRLARGGQAQQDLLRRQQITNQTRDESIRLAKEAGLIVPPMSASLERPGGLNRVMTSIGGKAPLEQEISVRNKIEVDAAGRRAVGLPEDARLVPETLAAARTEAGNTGYAPVRAIPRFDVDKEYLNGLVDLRNKYLKETKGSKSLKSEGAETALSDATKGQFTGDQAVSLVSGFRESGFKNAKSLDPKVSKGGQYQVEVSKLIDDLIERSLQRSGHPELYDNYVAARKRIAISHDLEEAINPATGNIDARILGEKWKKNPRLMSGEMEKIARAGAVMKEGLQQVSTLPPGTGSTVGTNVLGTAAAVGTGNLWWLGLNLLPAARAGVRKVAMSKPWQWAFVKPQDYKPSVAARMFPELFPQSMSGLLGAYIYPGEER